MKNKPSLPRFYSQNGEDIILDRIFAGQEKGFFIEVGCIDGRRFSNTLTFEERGWKGLCVEAHKGYIEMLRNNRPGSVICHCAVSDSDEPLTPFYANARGSLSTLDPSKEADFKNRFGSYFSGFDVQQVPRRKLDTLFEELGIGTIDLLSIDVEGHETEVLKGLDLSRYRPRVLVIEADSFWEEDSLDGILLKAGYFKSIKLVNNVFYLLDRGMEEQIRNKTITAMLTNTRHPLDAGEDARLHVSFTYPNRLEITRQDKP